MLGLSVPTKDANLILTYLLGKKVKPATVRMYLAGTRWIPIAKGVDFPEEQSALAKTILKGYQNIHRDPDKAAAQATHRPVTIPFLRLLGHATNKF